MSGYKQVGKKSLADLNRDNNQKYSNRFGERSSTTKSKDDALIGHPPLIREMIKASGLEKDSDASSFISASEYNAQKNKLESQGYKASGEHKPTGAIIYKHPQEKGSVLLHRSGHVSSGEFGS